MANNKSTYLINAVLSAALRNIALQVAAQYISLHSGDPGLVGSNEISGNAYARVITTFTAPSASSSNVSAVIFPAPTPANWGTLTYAGVWDALTTGNFLYRIPLNFSVVTSWSSPKTESRSMIAGQTCSSCAAFSAMNAQCRRKSPTPIVIPSPVSEGQLVTIGVYPATKADQWCLEWVTAPSQENAT